MDIDKNEAVLSISGGEISMIQGVPVGERGTVITTKEGLKGMASSGFPLEGARVKDGSLYC